MGAIVCGMRFARIQLSTVTVSSLVGAGIAIMIRNEMPAAIAAAPYSTGDNPVPA